MSDNNLPVMMPTHVDDYQPPQVANDMNVPAGFNPPLAPVSASPVVSDFSSVVPKSNQITAPDMSVRTMTPAEKLILAQTADGFVADDEIASTSKVPVQKEDQNNMNMLNATLPNTNFVAPATSDATPVTPTKPATPATVAPVATPAEPVSVSATNVSVKNSPVDANQSLEAQNIFDLLGVSDGKPEEKEAFLDELQDVIWEDFLGHDVDLLLTEEEMTKLNALKAKGNAPEVQEEILVFLEKLIPDLEDMMMDKAIELKEDMVMERIAGLREFHSQNVAALEKITQAEKHISEGRWADASQLLNSIK